MFNNIKFEIFKNINTNPITMLLLFWIGIYIYPFKINEHLNKKYLAFFMVRLSYFETKLEQETQLKWHAKLLQAIVIDQ